MEDVRTLDAIEAARSLYDTCPSPILLYRPDTVMVYANAAYERMVGRRREELLGRRMFDVYPPDPSGKDANAVASITEAIARMNDSDEPVIVPELQHNLADPEGGYEERFWSLVQWPVRRDGELVMIAQRSEDITEQVRHRRMMDAVRQSAERASGLAFFSYHPDTDRFVRSTAIDTMFGYEPDEAGPFAAPFFDRVLPDDLPAVHEEVTRAFAAGAGTSAAFDYRVAIPGDPRLRYVRVRAAIERDPVDGILKMFGVFVDLSDMERSRQHLKELSERNAALVVESNHRIKNSLAIAAAMLSYHTQVSDDPAVQEALTAAATRIMAIADVHGELFGDSGVEWVDAGRLIERFASSFERTVGSDKAACDIAVTAQRTMLPSRHAVTLALMLNELLTNAIKHGISREGRCDVVIDLSSSGDRARLVVENTMPGERFAKITSEGVGTELVQAFALQLGGAISTGADGKTFRAEFTFPVPAEDQAAADEGADGSL